jgi:hypothetical protein
MRTVDKITRVNRRNFLKVSAASAAAAGAASAGAALVRPGEAWAGSLKAISPDAAPTLLAMVRDLYPHDRLGDSYYERALETIDTGAADDPEIAKLLNDGAQALNEMAENLHGRPYSGLTEEAERVAVLKSIETTPFFQKVRSDMVVALYNQPEVWRKLGYEGPSAEFGGYLSRGFDDIDWIENT